MLSKTTKAAYAAAVIDAAKHGAVSPLMITALIHHESRWQSRVGGLGGQCIGFGQVCLHIYPECKTFKEPDCLARKARLLDPYVNIKAIGQFMRAWQTTCPKLTGKKATERGILSGYGGYDLAAGTRCGLKKTRRGWVMAIPKGVLDILKIKREFERRFGKG